MSHAALRSNHRTIATHDRTSRHPQVFKRIFPDYAVGDNCQKCHAQLSFHHERDDHQAENWIRTTDTGSFVEELDYQSPEDRATDCSLPVGRLNVCGKD